MPFLNTDSSVPLYAQLAEKLSRQIREGEFEAGMKIPSENVLAERYEIGRPTVRQATELLIRRGYLERRRGSGTFVRERSQHVDLFSLGGTQSSFNKQGIELSTRLLSAPHLETGQGRVGGSFYVMERLSSVGEEPVLIERFWFSAAAFPFFDQNQVAGRSLSQVVAERYQMEALSAEQSFSVAQIDADRAILLELDPGDPVLHVERVLHFPKALSAVRVRMWCRSDRFQFSQTLRA